jgi:hypothetical protein
LASGKQDREMSFFSDLFEGNTGNLGNDIEHAPSSFANHPSEIIDVGAAALTALTLGAGAGVFGAGALGADAAAGAADVGAGAADLGAGAADLGAGGGLAADLGIGDIGATAAGGDLAAGLGIGDIGSTLGAGAADALGTVPADTLAFLPEVGADLGGGSLAFGSDVFGGLSDAEGAILPDTSTLATGSLDSSITGMSPSFAETDAELSGGLTGTAPAAAPSYVMPSVANAPAGADTGLANANASFGAFDAPAAGGGGLTSQLSSVLSSPYTRLGLAAAPLALALGRGESSLPASAGQAQANASQLSAFGSQQLAAGQAGTLNAGQMALITKSKDDLTNAARQAMYNMGVQNPEADTRWPQMLANIDTQVTAMTAQMIQQEITNGLSALGSSSQTLNQIAQMQMNADQNFTNTLVNATKALGLAAGSGAIRTTTTTTQAAA